MPVEEHEFAERLLSIYENVLLTEEQALSKGYFSDLSNAEMHTLDAIGPYEARTMTETATNLGITTGTLTVAIDRLVKKGYVVRKRDEVDRRVVRISLTKNGKLASRIHNKFHTVLAKRILEPYTPEEQELLMRMVTDIDSYIESQKQRYGSSDSIRKTAKSVASDSRRRDDNG
ncbi:MAG: MarR family transcriptional regulator [Clostridia bacterium]|nr:MarR family transcriptional regulator [Clostridia bacterium]